jgi:dolichol-phosphate mannosyltransferase
MIAVDDGSTDDSARYLKAYQPIELGSVTLLRLHRNSGSHVAIAMGLSEVESSAALILAADGQDTYTAAEQMIESWLDGAEVVWGERVSRDDSRLDSLTSRVFGWLLAPVDLSGVRVPTGSFILIDELRVQQFQQMASLRVPTYEKVAWLNARSMRVPYERPRRAAGISKWGMRRRISAGISAILRSRTALIRVARYLAVAVLVAALLCIAGTLVWGLIFGSAPGWTTISGAILAALAFQSVFFIIIIEYVSRTYAAGYELPTFIIVDPPRGE